MKADTIIVYGSYGYTGRLIVEECRRRGLNAILSGRDGRQLAEQGAETGYPVQSVALSDTKALHALLERGAVVIHCAGPFQFTARHMVEACLNTGTHYTDITGEYQVFDKIFSYAEAARNKGIMLMPGTGFDVVPSDCLALYLKEKLPTATSLQLAFASSGGFSRGTSKTMVEGLGYGSTIRKEGKYVTLKTAEKVLDVDFGPFTSKAVCIPWGDIATAWRSTGIPNIEVYAGVSSKTIRFLKASNFLNPLLGQRWVKNFLQRQIENQPPGPSAEKLATARSYLWGRVKDDAGNELHARIQTLNGYMLTAKTSVLIAEKILNKNLNPGFHTPAMAYGANLILEISGTTRTG
ncbi:MAG: saccharopine dehydrogenase NADP-binding domain-containing protein [Flammeovirgaceae bacterium]|nr:MAG: saccharopine dehydrogenase NADP-binding domain-containing protein [Flammeovirgaceae bacterium]